MIIIIGKIYGNECWCMKYKNVSAKCRSGNVTVVDTCVVPYFVCQIEVQHCVIDLRLQLGCSFKVRITARFSSLKTVWSNIAAIDL